MRRAALLFLALAACEPAAGRGGDPVPGAAGIPAAGAATQGPADTTFAGLVASLSEPGAYFDTDNLISNESSYLHVLPELETAGVRGGVYLGVGPAQNFSYIAALRPERVFLVDIRRDNALQHLWFRALFELSDTRLDYLCLMVARDCGGASDGLPVTDLAARVDAAPPLDATAAAIDEAADRAATFGVPLDSADLATIRGIHRRFAADGLDLRFNSHGRAPRSYYPTLRRLILERDRDGRQSGYLADEADFAFVRDLQRAGRVVPVVGDLAGPHAVRAIGAFLEERGERVSAFYVSNVEYYLFGDGTFPAFAGNLAALPAADDAVLIRSVFRSPRRLPGSVAGYASTQTLHAIPALLRAWEQGRIRGYGDLVEAGASL